MPRNCCLPFCTTNVKGNPGIPYHQFPNDWGRRSAWMSSIYRLAPNAKKYKWQPVGNAVVCGLHFTEADYNRHSKATRLLPSAVPTVFHIRAEHAHAARQQEKRKGTEYNCAEEGSASKAGAERVGEDRTRPQGVPQLPPVDERAKGLVFGAIFKTSRPTTSLVHSERKYNGTDDGTLSRSVVECKREEREHKHLPPSEQEGVGAPVKTRYRAASRTDAECQTTLNVARLMSEARKTELRLKLQLAREKNVLRNLRTELSGYKEVLRHYDSNGDVQAFLKVLEAAEDGDEAALSIKNQVAAFEKTFSRRALSERCAWARTMNMD